MINDRLEPLILYNLLTNEEYTRKVIPFVQAEYFSEKAEKLIFEAIKDFVIKYNSLPTKEAILITLNEDKKLKQDEYENIASYLSHSFSDIEKVQDSQWLLDNTESFCKSRAFYNALVECVHISDDKSGKFDRGQAPKIMSDALAVGFSTDIGHDYVEDFDKRFDFYHRVEEKMPFDLEFFNKISGGGVPKKSLSVIMAGTGVGKSLCLCHFAASFLNQGKQVLYITLEMAEEKIAQRVDANLLNINIQELEKIPKQIYEEKISRLKSKTLGKLIIKEFPTAMAHVGHFKQLLNELHLKKNFKPDVLIVDYLNLMSSFRVKPGAMTNSYLYVKSIAEEIRGLAVEYNVPIFSATQTNRAGFQSSDPGMENTSESFGLPATVDLFLTIISNEDLDSMNQLLVKQLKNRFNDVTKNRRFVIGCDKSHMRLYDVAQSAQANISDSGQEDDTPGFDKTSFGKSMKAERKDGYSKIKV